MIHDIVSAIYRGDYKIEIEFDDGKKGIMDFSKYLKRGGIFQRFQEMDFFHRFKVHPELGVLTWENGIDIAPETLYAEVTGSPLPDWMEIDSNLSPNESFQKTA
jgi:hypothetical protein